MDVRDFDPVYRIWPMLIAALVRDDLTDVRHDRLGPTADPCAVKKRAWESILDHKSRLATVIDWNEAEAQVTRLHLRCLLLQADNGAVWPLGVRMLGGQLSYELEVIRLQRRGGSAFRVKSARPVEPDREGQANLKNDRRERLFLRWSGMVLCCGRPDQWQRTQRK